MKKLWKKFNELTERCYSSKVKGEKDFNVWNETFAVLLDIVKRGREKSPNFAGELIDLDAETDFQYDVSGWLEYYLDELDMRGYHKELQQICEKLLDLFLWEEDDPSGLRCSIAASLAAQGKQQEALEFCEEWYKTETDNIVAAASLIYARMGVRDLQGAEEIVNRYIKEETKCTEDNDILFYAAAALYKVKGDKEAEERINKAVQKFEDEYEDEAAKFFSSVESGEIDFSDLDLWDEELPFS